MGLTFRWLWFGAGAANLGDGVVLTALPLIALGAGASPAEIALVTTAATIAWPLFGLHAGWIVDRVPAARLLAIVGAARAAAFAGLAAATAFETAVVPVVMAAALVYGVAETLVDTALIAAVPSTVAPRALTPANARLEATVNIANQLAGPPLAGAIVAISSTAAALTGSGLYALAGLAAVELARLQRARHRRTASADPADAPVEPGAGGETSVSAPRTVRVRDGLRLLLRDPLQRMLTLLTAAMSLVWGAWSAVFVLHAVAPGPLALGPAAYGWLLTAMAAGGIAASVVTAPLERRIGTTPLLFIDLLGTVALVLPSALGANVWVVGAGLVAAGAGSSVWRIVVAVVRQRRTPPELLGRVYAASRVISWGALPLGSALAGAGAAAFGVSAVLAGASVAAGVVVLGFLAAWPGLAAQLPRTAD